MPPHRVYIEPFLGGGAVMRLKRPAVLNIGIDLVDPSKLPMLSTPDENSEWARGIILEPAPKTPIPDPLAKPSDGRRRASSVSPLTAATVAPSDGSSPRFHFQQGDGIAFLESWKFFGYELVYCDPPYVRSTRSGRPLYEHDMTDVDHRRLLRVIQELPCMVMLSGYWSEMYARALKTWNHIEYEAMTRGGMATEHLWFNFPPPVELHDYRYLGENFRQRERIKRKKQRWTARLRRMPPLERQALLAAIADSASSDDPRGTPFSPMRESLAAVSGDAVSARHL